MTFSSERVKAGLPLPDPVTEGGHASTIENGKEPSADTDVEPRSDLGNARRLIKDCGDDIRYAPEWGKWLGWDGRVWEADVTGKVMGQAKKVVDHLLDDAYLCQDAALFKFAIKSQGASRLGAMVELASTEPGVPVLVKQLDADPWALCVANGTLDLRTGQLRPHDRADLVTKITDVPWDPTATCPTFDGFIERILPDPDVRSFQQRCTGYALTGDVSEEILLMMFGTGANGKTTFKEVVLELLGDHGRPASPKLLLATKHEEHPTAVADLFGRRLVVATEVEDGMRLDEALVKELTGRDTLKARFMRQDFWGFKPTHKLGHRHGMATAVRISARANPSPAITARTGDP